MCVSAMRVEGDVPAALTAGEFAVIMVGLRRAKGADTGALGLRPTTGLRAGGGVKIDPVEVGATGVNVMSISSSESSMK